MTKQFVEIGLTAFFTQILMSELLQSETESRGVIPHCHHLSHNLCSYHNKSCLHQLLNPLATHPSYSKYLPEKKSNMKTVKNRLFFTRDKINSRPLKPKSD